MIVLWNSADMEVEFTLVDGGSSDTIRWQADRTLARDMLSFMHRELEARQSSFEDIEGIGVFRGPGSFTGLRIGLSVLNTIAHAQGVPIVGAIGDDWRRTCLDRLRTGENDRLVLPEYGAPARVTKPRK